MVIDSRFTVATADGGVEAGDQWDDLDAEAVDNPLMVTEYSADIFTYMRQIEVSFLLFTIKNPLTYDSFSEQQCPTPCIWIAKRNLPGHCGASLFTGSSKFMPILA